MHRFPQYLIDVESGNGRPAALQRAITLVKNHPVALTICTIVDEVETGMQMAINALTPAEFRDAALNEKRHQLEENTSSGNGDFNAGQISQLRECSLTAYDFASVFLWSK